MTSAAAHVLDRPLWHALSGQQRDLAHGDARALRVDPAIGPFGAARDLGEEAQRALAALARGLGPLAQVEREEVAPAPGTTVVASAPLVQMVCAVPRMHRDHPAVELLSRADMAEMAILAEATEPGPWAPETIRYGAFYGIRERGRLVAMAGERMRPGGHAEVSGVCTDPAWRGKGLAAALIGRVMLGFAERDEVPFLHVHRDNAGAIALYERLGFAIRCPMTVTVIAWNGGAA